MGAAVLVVVVAVVAVAVAGWASGAERHPTLPEEESAESAETSGESDDAGALVESVKRNGWEASSAGRRDMCARMDDALRASTVLEYNIVATCHGSLCGRAD